MDRRVKERLVGASILVVLVVLIVPELLSGPKQPTVSAQATAAGPNEVHNVIVDLTTSKATTADDNAATAAAAVEGEPASAAGGPVAPDAPPSDGAETPPRAPPPTIVTLQAQQPASGSSPGAAQSPAAAVENRGVPPKSPGVARTAAVRETQPDPTHHNWTVQLGSFASRVNADKLQRTLKAEGFPAVVAPIGAGKAQRFRVRIAGLPDRSAADKINARLKKEGHAASIVAP